MTTSKKVEAEKVIEAAKVVEEAKEVVAVAVEAQEGKLKAKYKEYLISIVLTFLAGFSTELLFSVDFITLTTIQDGTVWGLLFTAVRTGLKVVLEGIVLFLKPKA